MPELNQFEAALAEKESEAPKVADSAVPAVMTEEKSGLSWGKIALLGLVVALILGGMGGFIYWRDMKWRWEKIPMPETMARVTAEWPLDKLGGRLLETGKIRDVDAFLQAAREAKLQNVKPGGYMLPKEAGPRDLAALFAGGPQLVKITFPEGWTAGQMARRLASAGFSDAATFNRLAYGQTLVSPWEGKLFPDTYYLAPKASGEQIIARLNERFNEVAKDLSRPFPKIQGKEMTLAQVVILASLVERETSEAAERPLIAGVLLNRLNIKMRLQCDASVQYARRRAEENAQLKAGDGYKARLLFRDLKIDSPYNTYQIAGLPPGPICNPGQAALKAAARPETSPYFFYVMSPKLGHHRFAKTFADHQRNIALAKSEK